MDEIHDFINNKKLIIGICNGFQVLVKAGLLPDISGKDKVTLSLNDSAKFEDRWCYLKRAKSISVFTKNLPETIYLPVAHAEGKFIPGNKKVLEKLKKNGQIVFRYTDGKSKSARYPWNPNGSVDNIAGISSDVSVPGPSICPSFGGKSAGFIGGSPPSFISTIPPSAKAIIPLWSPSA